uniref:Delta-like protein n=1 Tax=Caenorhabditis japonica TaxID=281687 RepID=A0A8R1I4G0_CAEJA
MPSFSLFLLLTLPCFIQTSGYLEVRIKSAFKLNVTVEVAEGIYFPINKKTFTLPLTPNSVGRLTNIRVKFHRPGLVLVKSGPLEKFGLVDTVIRSERWNTQTMIVNPTKSHLPFTGFKLEIKCDRNWHGIGCDKFCNDNLAKMMKLRCNDQGKLGCPIGFRGWTCEKPLLNSQPECQCQNNGTCVTSTWIKNTAETTICECPYKFEGAKCEKKAYDYTVPLIFDMYGASHKWVLVNEFYNNSLVDNELF